VTVILTIDAATPDVRTLGRAGAVVRQGGLVAFPTESFYGLGVDALDPSAVERVFETKGRPATSPLLVLVDGVAMVEGLAAEVLPGARELMARHWPGPLTLVLRAAPHVPAALTAGCGTIGVRMPGHPVALGLVGAVGAAITAPSAHPSGEAPATTAAQVRAYFADALDVILDGGTTAGGTGSTVADCTAWPPRVLRQGPVAL
jgi:L-threonylcarbamoyladenylate synthase